MALQPVPAQPAAPPFPSLAEKAAGTYNQTAYTWGTGMPTFAAGVKAIGDNVYANAGEAIAAAGNAQGAAATAIDSASIALAAANFKGLYDDLVGALNKPATVKKNGRFWALRNNLANVVASVPSDGNTDWISLDAGARVTAVITTNTVGVVGVLYLIHANGITLTAPTVWSKGDYFGFRETAGLTGAVVAFGATKVRGRTPGNLNIDAPGQAVDLTYEDATRGLV